MSTPDRRSILHNKNTRYFPSNIIQTYKCVALWHLVSIKLCIHGVLFFKSTEDTRIL